MHLHPHTTEIQGLLVFLIFGLTIMSRASIAAVMGSEGNFNNIRTQRKRYSWVLLGVVLSFTPVVFYTVKFSPILMYNEITSWPERYSFIGTFAVAIVLVAMLTPLWGVFDAMTIYRYPSVRAKLVRFGPVEKRGYYYTESVRVRHIPGSRYWGRDRPAEPLPQIKWYTIRKPRLS